MELILLFLFMSVSWTASRSSRDLNLPNLNTTYARLNFHSNETSSNETASDSRLSAGLALVCGSLQEPDVYLLSCHNAWKKMFDLPERRIHILARHVRPLPPSTTLLVILDFLCGPYDACLTGIYLGGEIGNLSLNSS